MQHAGVDLLSHAVQLGDRPQLEKLIGAINVQLEQYSAGKLDKVYLAYSRFVNAMKQEPVIEQLLPLSSDRQHSGGYLVDCCDDWRKTSGLFVGLSLRTQ